MDFKIGDTVRWRLGGPRMLVSMIGTGKIGESYLDHSVNKTLTVPKDGIICRWFSKEGMHKSACFRAWMLRKCGKKEKP